MTIETTAIKAVALGNGATTVWPFTFLIPDDDQVVITLVDVASGNETVVSPALYSVNGAGQPAGGNVTYPLSGSPLTSAYYFVIERVMPLEQETTLLNQGAALPAVIEDALDYLTMITQQLQDQINRSIVFSVADTTSVTLPTATARAGLFLGFDANGDPVAVDGLTAGTTVSAAMIPVVTAPTTAAALTALGIPGSLLDALIPAGTIWDYAGTTAPSGFLLAFGQACTPTYPTLRALLVAAGSPYGTNGVDPLLPDLRSRASVGKSNMGGVDNGLWAGGTVLGAVAGTQTKTLITGNLPAYTPAGTIVTNLTNGTGIGTSSGAPTADTGVAVASVNGVVNITAASAFTGTPQGGASTPLDVRTPSIILNKIVKAH